MKRFWVFAGDSYYASGGMADFIGQFDDLESAKNAGVAADCSWWHVLDVQIMKVVALHQGSYTGQVPQEMIQESA